MKINFMVRLNHKIKTNVYNQELSNNHKVFSMNHNNTVVMNTYNMDNMDQHIDCCEYNLVLERFY